MAKNETFSAKASRFEPKIGSFYENDLIVQFNGCVADPKFF
jgi:hypothetical protein